MQRALISVYNKSGIEEFAKELNKLGFGLLSTGGTAKYLKSFDFPVIEVSEYTHFPEILGGRVKTLHPIIFGGILAQRDNPNHIQQIKNLDTIDVVVVNLYPFLETMNRGAPIEEIIEMIDVGGVALIRAAAKNYKDVLVLIDPNDYNKTIELLRNNTMTLEYRKYLAAKAFQHTASYDSHIAAYFSDDLFQEQFTLTGKRIQSLRYGENPHQKAFLYKTEDGYPLDAEFLSGKELSFNNIVDIDAALRFLNDFIDEKAIVVIKHNQACGFAVADDLLTSYAKAYEGDKESAFGGILAINGDVDEVLAREIYKNFYEVIYANDFSEKALEILREKRNLRILRGSTKRTNWNFNIKQIGAGFLLQTEDFLKMDNFEVVTEVKPDEKTMKDLIFAWKLCKNFKSNSIVFAKDGQLVGSGAGQTSRVMSVKIAGMRAMDKSAGSSLASDGFFPFKDSVTLAGEYGIKAIIQPGGSRRDEEVIEEANRLGIPMIFTHRRHFYH
ncbi:bifunctional phosphoribosylaminoimidazolecarboxamide formyltransferase/IMP cyclohydrolase [Thermodesulfobium sp. 4217-1]|uniref:bifunctional phosphoribosylaminoimidazolecarboxamide formyltransferase/IMP cyclohydrolase n=1 Tax=Thermodesulfobium sp. 4217-1 TaxID=3120013 RepID=UPI0032221830